MTDILEFSSEFTSIGSNRGMALRRPMADVHNKGCIANDVGKLHHTETIIYRLHQTHDMDELSSDDDLHEQQLTNCIVCARTSCLENVYGIEMQRE